jgi:hypothetical protein
VAEGERGRTHGRKLLPPDHTACNSVVDGVGTEN